MCLHRERVLQAPGLLAYSPLGPAGGSRKGLGDFRPATRRLAIPMVLIMYHITLNIYLVYPWAMRITLGCNNYYIKFRIKHNVI